MELNESFKLIREPNHWFANWFDQAFEQNWLKEWIICEWASLIAQRKVLLLLLKYIFSEKKSTFTSLLL